MLLEILGWLALCRLMLATMLIRVDSVHTELIDNHGVSHCNTDVLKMMKPLKERLCCQRIATPNE